jgi:hypothetical protein
MQRFLLEHHEDILGDLFIFNHELSNLEFDNNDDYILFEDSLHDFYAHRGDSSATAICIFTQLQDTYIENNTDYLMPLLAEMAANHRRRVA